MYLQTKRGGGVSFAINAAGHVCKTTIELVVYLGGAISAHKALSIDRDDAACSESLGVLPTV